MLWLFSFPTESLRLTFVCFAWCSYRKRPACSLALFSSCPLRENKTYFWPVFQYRSPLAKMTWYPAILFHCYNEKRRPCGRFFFFFKISWVLSIGRGMRNLLFIFPRLRMCICVIYVVHMHVTYISDTFLSWCWWLSLHSFDLLKSSYHALHIYTYSFEKYVSYI